MFYVCVCNDCKSYVKDFEREFESNLKSRACVLEDPDSFMTGKEAIVLQVLWSQHSEAQALGKQCVQALQSLN